MPDAPDLTPLIKHLAELAQPHGFLVDVQISQEKIESPGSKGGDLPHIHVSVRNTSKSPPPKVEFDGSFSDFERVGVHLFDVRMSEAFRNLSAL
jgi:hypothetical protein